MSDLVSRYEDVRRVYSDPLFSRAETVKPEVPLLLPGTKLASTTASAHRWRGRSRGSRWRC